MSKAAVTLEAQHATTNHIQNHNQTFRFLDLPPEVRSLIYRKYYGTAHIIVTVNDTRPTRKNNPTDKAHHEHEHEPVPTSTATTTTPFTYIHTTSTSKSTFTPACSFPTLSLELTNHQIRDESIQIRSSHPSTLLTINCKQYNTSTTLNGSDNSFPFPHIITPWIHTYIPHLQYRATFPCPIFDNDDMSLLMEPFVNLHGITLDTFRVNIRVKPDPDPDPDKQLNDTDTNTNHSPRTYQNKPLWNNHTNQPPSDPQEAATFYSWRYQVRFRMELDDILRLRGGRRVHGILGRSSLPELWFHIMFQRIQFASKMENKTKIDVQGRETKIARESWDIKVRVTGDDDGYDYNQLPEPEQGYSGPGSLERWWSQYLRTNEPHISVPIAQTNQ